MDINTLTEDQRTQILWHFRAAVRAKAVEWDHEAAIERILDREISNFHVDDWATNVGENAVELSPEDLTFVEWDDIVGILIEED